jgi:ADP-ribose pyrophosphatase YjhB (NUDIX family)
MPGGRCELLENSKETLIREMKEELNVNVKVNRVLYFVENFFNYENMRHHEVAIYYLMQIPKNYWPSIQKSAFKGREVNNELIFQWFDIDKLGEIKLYPTFLCDKLCNIKSYPEHIIHVDY